jgi:hypothetical protein
MGAVDERMTQRVMDELRAVYPHDDDELLRATATKTTLGAAIAFRLAVIDVWQAVVAALPECLRVKP